MISACVTPGSMTVFIVNRVTGGHSGSAADVLRDALQKLTSRTCKAEHTSVLSRRLRSHRRRQLCPLPHDTWSFFLHFFSYRKQRKLLAGLSQCSKSLSAPSALLKQAVSGYCWRCETCSNIVTNTHSIAVIQLLIIPLERNSFLTALYRMQSILMPRQS